MSNKKIHIGSKIAQLLAEKRITKTELARRTGMTPANAVYLVTRTGVDTETLWKIGKALQHNFFKHYPIDEENQSAGEFKTMPDERDKTIEELKRINTDLEKQLEATKRDMVFQKQENTYLKKINDLLEMNLPKKN